VVRSHSAPKRRGSAGVRIPHIGSIISAAVPAVKVLLGLTGKSNGQSKKNEETRVTCSTDKPGLRAHIKFVNSILVNSIYDYLMGFNAKVNDKQLLMVTVDLIPLKSRMSHVTLPALSKGGPTEIV
jgi:hypothetical protein